MKLSCPATPFHDAAAAWHWAMAVLEARHAGARCNIQPDSIPRPCDADDILRELQRLYDAGTVTLAHARVLRRWGLRGVAPALRADPEDCRLWREATQRLGAVLAAKGYVAAP